MTRKRPYSTFVAPFGYELHAAYTPEQWAWCARTFGLDADPGAAGRTDMLTHVPDDPAIAPAPVWVVWINADQHADPAARVNVCSHEAVHVTLGLLDHIGAKNLSDEPTAYLLAWITEWLWQHLPKQQKEET